MLSISVIIPSYNRAQVLTKAVQSVLAQTAPPLEIIIVDDGSTDDTARQCAAMGAAVRYFRKDNGGVSSARNFGIRQAQGDWLAFLDSDDEWFPDKLEKQWQAIAAQTSDACFTGICQDDGSRYDEIAQLDPTLSAGTARTYHRPLARMVRTVRHPMVQTLLISRSLMRELGGFDESLWVAEDTALFYRLISRSSVTLINEGLARITRVRTARGLSDATDTAAVSRRLECYLRVQRMALAMLEMESTAQTMIATAETPPLELALAIRAVHGRIGYFLSRQAELAHLHGNAEEGRALALESLRTGGDVKTRVRSWLLANYPLCCLPFLRRKWGAAVHQ